MICFLLCRTYVILLGFFFFLFTNVVSEEKKGIFFMKRLEQVDYYQSRSYIAPGYCERVANKRGRVSRELRAGKILQRKSIRWIDGFF